MSRRPSRPGAEDIEEMEAVLDLTLSPAPSDGRVLVLSDVEDVCLLPFDPSQSPHDDSMRRPNLGKLYSNTSSYQRAPTEDTIGIKSIAFGIFGGPNSFSAEWEKPAGGQDELRFQPETRRRKEAMVVELGDKQRKIRISVELQTITRIQRSSGGRSFYVHLRLPPLFEILLLPPTPGETRWSARQVPAFDEHHAKITPFASRVLRIHLRDLREVPHFLSRLETRGLPRVVNTKVDIEPTRRIGGQATEKINGFMRQLELPVAFQIDKLLKNGLIDPIKLVDLRDKIKDIVRVQGSAKTERILGLFADSLVRLEELGEVKPVEIVLSDDDDECTDAIQSRKRKRPASSPEVISRKGVLVIDEADEEEEEEEEDDDDDDVILPPSFLPTRSAIPRTPHDLSVEELAALLDHAVTRSTVLAPLYSAVDASLVSRQVTITPTSFLLGGPNLEESNSIARRYERPEQFLRVAVRNEDGTLVERESDSIVEARFKKIFQEGFEVGGRKWHFLAWAASSLKSGSCFFVSPFEQNGSRYTPETIHKDIGDFTGDPTALVPAKYFARISQAFTSSRPSLDLCSDQISEIPDLVSPNGSLYSDGVGSISPSLAAEVVATLNTDSGSNRASPTCFQVRIGGAKGMLQVDPSLQGRSIALRPSQIKFRSTLNSLSIAETFIARTGFLNRPLIKLLEDLGVPAESFLKLQRSATQRVRKARTKLISAIRLLDDWNLSHSSRLSSTLSFLARTKTTSNAVFSNPFVAQCLDAAVIHILRDIKFKARIPLPGCYNLVGVVDISRTLAEDEIYARIEKEDGKIVHLEGTMAISRSPTNHPGDVRIVKAVGKLAPGTGDRIRNLVNCVVFSAKGDRSLPSKLAGGDLDGDLYLLLDEASGLVPTIVHPPAAYDASITTRLDREATLSDGIDFFFEYLANDATALVATRQLLLADWYSQGLFHPDCIKLAQMHSDCVDFVKSGTAVSRDDIPRIPLEMKEKGGRPDFASLPGQDSYSSPKVLGQLYRAIDLDLVKAPTLDTTLLDPGRSLTNALLAMKLPDGTRLPAKPPRQLVSHFEAILVPFSSELRKISDLSHPPTKEEELFLHILVKHKLERSDKLLLSNRGERTDELFRLVRKEIAGKEEEGTKAKVVRAWSAWYAAVEADEDHVARKTQQAKGKSEDEGKFGLRSWGFLALGVLGELVAKLEKEQVEVLILD